MIVICKNKCLINTIFIKFVYIYVFQAPAKRGRWVDAAPLPAPGSAPL